MAESDFLFFFLAVDNLLASVAKVESKLGARDGVE